MKHTLIRDFHEAVPWYANYGLKMSSSAHSVINEAKLRLMT